MDNNNQNKDLNNNINDNNLAENSATQNDYYNNDAYYSNNNYDDNYSDTTYEEPEKKKNLWWKILLGILVLLIIIILLLKFCTGGSSDDEKYANLKNKLCAAAEKYVEENPTIIDKSKAGTATVIKLQKLADANLIESRINNPYYSSGLFKKSTETKYYSMDNSVRLTVMTDGTLNCEMVDNSTDTTAPELRLNGDAEISLAVGTEFADPGYTATDDFDGDITSNVVRSGNVDITKAGEYEITYTVSDSAGNSTSKTRKVIIEEYANLDITLGSIIDSVTPMISLKGSNPYCMVKGTQYVEPGATATDNVDGNITDRIAVTNKVTGNLMGAFRVVYEVEDSSGNKAIAYRAVIVTTECPDQSTSSVVANNAPTITLIGKNSVTIAVGTEYIDLGATAYDKEDGDITSKITTDATAVNINSAGVYTVTYRVTDSAGMLATATRTVTVKKNVSGTPSVRFTTSKSNVTVEVGKGTDKLIAVPKAVDENGNAVSVSKAIEIYSTKESVSSIDWNSVGKYKVTYTAVHSNGNIKQNKSIVVTIEESAIGIGGKDSISIAKRDANCDITEADLRTGGVTFTEGSYVSAIVATDRLVCTIGTYDVNVTVKTNAGQTATKKIVVSVVDGTSGLDTSAPSKVTITGNSANTSDPYNSIGTWVGGAITGISLTFSATPAANTEISYYEWSKDCNTPGTTNMGSKTSLTTGSLSWTEEGSNSVCIRAVTTAGTKGPWSDPVKLYYDRTGPTVEFTHTWEDEKEDWYSATSLTLSYKANDSGSGLDHFEYTYDDVKAKKSEEIITYKEGTGSLTVKEDTESSRSQLFVYVRAVDKSGNLGEWTANPAYANMDTVKPYAPTLTVSGNNTSVVKLTANFADSPSVRPSGFGKLIYTVNSGEELTESSRVIIAPKNTTEADVTDVIVVWAVDKAGNRSDLSATETVTVAPMKNAATDVALKNGDKDVADGTACQAGTVYAGTSFTLTATPIPSDADEKEVTWSTSNANVAVVDENGKVVIKTVGSAVITAKIGDVSKTCTITSNKSPVGGGGGGTGCSAGTFKTMSACQSSCGGTCTYNAGNACAYSNCVKTVTNSCTHTSLKSCEASIANQGCIDAGDAYCSQNSSTGCWEARCRSNNNCPYTSLAACKGDALADCISGYTGCNLISSGCYGGYTCKTTAKTTTTKKTTTTTKSCSYTSLASCKGDALADCISGYTGCNLISSGCYGGYTCKTAGTKTCWTETTKNCTKYNTVTVASGSCSCKQTTSDTKSGTCSGLLKCNCPSGYSDLSMQNSCIAAGKGSCSCKKTVTSYPKGTCQISGLVSYCTCSSGTPDSVNCGRTVNNISCDSWSSPTTRNGLTTCNTISTMDKVVTCSSYKC